MLFFSKKENGRTIPWLFQKIIKKNDKKIWA